MPALTKQSRRPVRASHDSLRPEGLRTPILTSPHGQVSKRIAAAALLEMSSRSGPSRSCDDRSTYEPSEDEQSEEDDGAIEDGDEDFVPQQTAEVSTTTPNQPLAPAFVTSARPRYSVARSTTAMTLALPDGSSFTFCRMPRTVELIYREWAHGSHGNSAIEDIEARWGSGWRSSAATSNAARTREIKYRSNFINVRKHVVAYVRQLAQERGITCAEACAAIDAVVAGRIQQLIACIRAKKNPFVELSG